ncbi:MAG TPA: hypothetical protein DCE00_01985 [Firmicutes bacterium]|nr:hypothetical protein [Bacillota bacterium]
MVLQNSLITGNLYITDAVTEGAVSLINVEVAGEAVISGAGVNSVLMQDSLLQQLTITRQDSPVRVICQGETEVSAALLQGPAVLVEDELAEEAAGFAVVAVETPAEVMFSGSFTTVHLSEAQARLHLAAGIIDKILVAASGCQVNAAADAAVTALETTAPLTLVGQGGWQEVVLAAAGPHQLAGIFEKISILAQDTEVTLSSGSVAKLVVAQDAADVSLNLQKNCQVGQLELNGKTKVTGSGIIAQANINCAGVVIATEKSPGKAVLSKGVTALVCGTELPKKEEPVKTAAERPKTPSKPSTSKPKPKPQPEPKPTHKPTDVKRYVIGDKVLVPGELTVTVELYAADPSGYTVEVGGVKLKYNAQYKFFFGSVEENAARRGQVNVY